MHEMMEIIMLFTSLSGDGELHQQLAGLSVGRKLKLTVNTTTDNGATFVSDDLHGATIQATKHHVTGTSCILTVMIVQSGIRHSFSKLEVDMLNCRFIVKNLAVP